VSIYSRLYKYQSVERRSQLENFLTEALADVLIRTQDSRYGHDHEEFVLDVLLNSCQNERKTQLAAALRTAKQSKWKTQYPIKIGRSYRFLDMVLLDSGERPLIIVENKIYAALMTGEPDADVDNESDGGSESGSEPELEDQLQKYGRWLSDWNSGAALVLLTYATPPPTGFVEGDKKYSIDLRSVCWWQNVRNWLKRRAKPDIASTLSRELADFLDTNHMNEIDSEDLKTLSAYLTEGPDVLTKMKQAMSAAHERAVNLLPGVYEQRGRWPTTSDTQGLALSDWAYYFKQKELRWFIQWGVCAEPFVDWAIGAHDSLPSRLAAFVLVSRDSRPSPKIPLPVQKERAKYEQKGWVFVDTEREKAFSYTDLGGLLASEHGFSQAIDEWLKQATSEAAAILKEAEQKIK
jgi:hypothetical protein